MYELAGRFVRSVCVLILFYFVLFVSQSRMKLEENWLLLLFIMNFVFLV